MNIWSWIDRIEDDAYQNDDRERINMVRTFYKALRVADDDPDLSLNLLNQSRAIAQQCEELWWVQLTNHWELQFRIYNKRDLTNTLELAVQSAVETRKPHYTEFPQRICLHEDLIRVYMRQDPIGHLDMIEDALGYMETELNPRVECFLCFQQLKISQKILKAEYAEAKTSALALLQYAGKDPFHLCHAYQYLCEIACLQNDWESIGEWAYLGASYAEKQFNNTDQRIEFTMWQAVYERHAGNEQVAHQRFVSAAGRATNYTGGLNTAYYDAVCAYHELGGELEKALKSRELFLSTLVNTAQYHAECECLLEIIRLRQTLGLLIEEPTQHLETIFGIMKNPSVMREKLERLLNPLA